MTHSSMLNAMIDAENMLEKHGFRQTFEAFALYCESNSTWFGTCDEAQAMYARVGKRMRQAADDCMMPATLDAVNRIIHNYCNLDEKLDVQIVQEKYGIALNFANGTSCYIELNDNGNAIIHIRDNADSDDMTRCIVVGEPV